MRRKVLLPLIVIIFILAVVFLLQILLAPVNLPVQDKLPRSSPQTFSPVPQRVFYISARSNIIGQLIGLTENIEVYFSRPVNEKSITVKVSPETPVNLYYSLDKQTLQIQTTQAWKFNTDYTIRLTGSLNREDFTSLDKEYFFDFKTEKLEGM
jgi:hypothetical protein